MCWQSRGGGSLEMRDCRRWESVDRPKVALLEEVKMGLGGSKVRKEIWMFVRVLERCQMRYRGSTKDKNCTYRGTGI